MFDRDGYRCHTMGYRKRSWVAIVVGIRVLPVPITYRFDLRMPDARPEEVPARVGPN